MDINKKKSHFIFIILGCLLPLIPIFLLFLFYYLPKDISSDVILLTGPWQAQYRDVTRTVNLPALFYSSDGKGLIPEYKGSSWVVTLQKKVIIEKNMQNDDLFLMICGTIFQTGRILLNDRYIGDIGEYQNHKKFGTAQGCDGFIIEKKAFKTTNILTIHLQSDDLLSFGLNDQRLFLGMIKTLRPYYEKNLFINNFFNFGVIFFSLFMIIIITIILIAEWNSSDRTRYFITGLYVMSSLLYNLFYSGAFINYILPTIWLAVGIDTAISLIVLVNLEFIYSIFWDKPGPLGKTALWINRGLSFSAVVLFLFSAHNNYLLNMVWENFSIYMIISFIFGEIVIISSIFKNRNPYSIVMGFANFIFLTAASNDVLSNQGILNTPLIGNVAMAILIIIGTIIVITEFVKISNTLKDKVAERTQELHVVNKVLHAANGDLISKRDLIQKELSIAKALQMSLVPNEKTIPKIPMLEIGTFYKPMEDIGGDLSDVIHIGKNLLGFLISDVSGHGVPAALIAMMVKTTFNSHAHPDQRTDNIMMQINNEMVKLIGTVDHYFTAYFGILDTTTRKFSYTNAGHLPAILYSESKKKIVPLNTEGTVMGSFSELTYLYNEVILEKGDGVVLYTDGIVEARNEKNEMYSEKRFLEFILQNGHLPTQKFIDKLLKELEMFCGTQLANDDQTLIYFKIV